MGRGLSLGFSNLRDEGAPVIHETTREILIRCDAVACPEVDWLPPGTDPHKWARREGWGTDGVDLFCPCCVRVQLRRAA